MVFDIKNIFNEAWAKSKRTPLGSVSNENIYIKAKNDLHAILDKTNLDPIERERIVIKLENTMHYKHYPNQEIDEFLDGFNIDKRTFKMAGNHMTGEEYLAKLKDEKCFNSLCYILSEQSNSRKLESY